MSEENDILETVENVDATMITPKESHVRIFSDDLSDLPVLWRAGEKIHNPKFKDISVGEIISEFISGLPGVIAYESGMIFNLMINFCDMPNPEDIVSVSQHVNALAIKLYGAGIGDMVK